VADLVQELSHEMWTFGAWPDDAHITFDNIDELRQLIQTGLPQKSSKKRAAGVALDSPFGVPIGP
jgi:hypothetical protein